jgi:hypothetical protein
MSTEPTDALQPWRDSDRSARRTAVVTVSAALVAMLGGATLPLWVGDSTVRTLLLGYHNGTLADWLWTFSATDAWWAIGAVVLVPVLCTVIGAMRTRRRFVDATRDMPTTVDLSTIGTAQSDGQREAQARSRQVDLAARQRRYTEQHRRRVSVWSPLGATFTFLLGGWFLIGIALSITDATATPPGAWLAAYSWALLLGAIIIWSAIASLVERRAAR